MTEPLTSSDVQAALDEQALGIQVETYDTSTATAPQAAASIGTPLGSIVKSLVFMINGRPIVALVAGDQKVDTRKIAAFYDVGRKKVKIATYEECVEHIGYEPGGVPPLGHRSAAPILIDRSLSRFETVYAAAGSPNTIFPIPFDTMVRITNGSVHDLVVET